MNVIQKQESGITAAQIDILARASVIPAGLPKEILEVFMFACNQHGLSPFKKEIYLIPYKGKYSTVVGIDGMRTKAARTGQHAGRDDAKFDVMPNGSYKTAAELKASKHKPISCTVTIYRAVSGMRCPFSKTVLFDEYCPAKTDEWSKWNTMPFNMIEKCAEAAALRMAFADETAGLSIEEEGAAMQDITIQAAELKTVEIGIAPDLIPRYQDLQDGLKGLTDFESVLNYYTTQFKESDLSDNRNFAKLIFGRACEVVKTVKELGDFFHAVKDVWKDDKELMKIISRKKQDLENAK